MEKDKLVKELSAELSRNSRDDALDKEIDFSDLPDAWTEEEAQKSKSPSESPGNADSPHPSEQEGSLIDDDLSNAEAAAGQEINAPQQGSNDGDLDEQFERHSKAFTQREESLRKKMFSLEQKLHSVDFELKERAWIRVSPFVLEVVEVMAEHLGISKEKIYMTSVLMFYRNCFCSEQQMMADIGLMLDAATLQNQVLANEASALEDLANLAIQAEVSPFNQTPQEEGQF